MTSPISIGMNGRFFPNNWRPAPQEIEFARQAGFTAMQFVGPADGLNDERLGADLETVAACLREAGITAVMEIPINVLSNGRTGDGRSLLHPLHANLPAIQTLGCTCVHYHMVLRDSDLTESMARQFEQNIIEDLATAVHIGHEFNFRFGIEHNELDYFPFNTPQSCEQVLTAVPHLHFVWDFNHAAPSQLAGYKALAPHVSMLHISDTPLPHTNYHWPLGQGNTDFTDYLTTLLQAGFKGPAILEIGGLPKSGGYGQDTDTALNQSHAHLQQAVIAATQRVMPE
ncbi:MAG: sugar phosphate isomerase/epimerase [Ardenticatenaceae bacterium]|nr:sugar phosphate isomerase/epimerase [Ardenticatenaceae bacterium]